jgi:hypothetical protein
MKKIIIVFTVLSFNCLIIAGSIPTDKAMVPRTKGSDIPGFNDGYYPTNINSRGFHWNIYSMKLTLDWEITKGDSSIFIGTTESLDTNSVNFTDMDVNFTYFSNNTTGILQNIKKRGIGDTDEPNFHSDTVRNGHGLATLSCAISGENNGIYAPMLGTAPKCSGFYLHHGLYSSYPHIDVDGIMDGKITCVDVTFQATSYYYYYIYMLPKGIVHTVGIGNTVSSQGDTISIFDPINNTSTLYIYPKNMNTN